MGTDREDEYVGGSSAVGPSPGPGQRFHTPRERRPLGMVVVWGDSIEVSPTSTKGP